MGPYKMLSPKKFFSVLPSTVTIITTYSLDWVSVPGPVVSCIISGEGLCALCSGVENHEQEK